MVNWMQALAAHYETLGNRYPNDKLLIVFDIDGTIIDMRPIIAHVLHAYDAEHGTRHFANVVAEGIDVHEDLFDELMAALEVAAPDAARIEPWYREYLWLGETINASHQPFPGVMELIRWFQTQSNTYVALNTGRPEMLREETVESLNALGREYGVEFTSELLWMNGLNPDHFIPHTKAVGIRDFQKRGYRVVAVIDNEPGNIESMVGADDDNEILFMHADTIFKTTLTHTPRTVRGSTYDVTPFLAGQKLAAE
ncbi:MAG: hypothetical protein HN403_10935 [Rhodospirillales bacterium]|jgi:phosphoglycolate phosphatase-like HAD superfamily hydrolase|nr:hypothetical protein [Rhodospirillales bacterium]